MSSPRKPEYVELDQILISIQIEVPCCPFTYSATTVPGTMKKGNDVPAFPVTLTKQ